MYNEGFKVEDYLTLYINEATRNGDNYTWQIPQTYYTNRRSKVSTVKCIGGTIEPAAVVHGLVINYVNGVQNAYASGNESGVLTHGYETIEHGNKITFNVSQGGELLVSARPNQITLKITDHNKATVSLQTQNITTIDIKGCITLKFCYYNQLETGENLHKQYNPTLQSDKK